MKRVALGISAAVLMLAGAGFAAEDAGTAGQSETRAQAQARAERLFDRLDLNHDGKLDQADRAARAGEMFDRLDTNHDGALSRQEYAGAHDHAGPEGAGDQGDMPGQPGMDQPPMGGEHAGGHHRGSHGMAMMIMQRADPGRTGIVGRDAFVKAALSLFDQADVNHDGVLTPAEHRAFTEAMRPRMHAEWHLGGPTGDTPPPPPAQ